MRTSTVAAAYSSSSSSTTKPKRRWTREQLLKNLQIIDGPLSRPMLPPTLPPSPPASRATSPARSQNKRKSETSSDQEHTKRHRTGSFSDRPQQQTHPQPPTHYRHQPQHQPHPPPAPLPPIHLRVSSVVPVHIPKSDPCEDGEVREESAVASSSRGSAATASVLFPPSLTPIRRPKRGKLPPNHHDLLHDKYHAAGRKLKYSGDSRFWSTYSSSHKEYRPLADPPPPGSLYHKHGGLIARLELVDALVCFTYALWNRDYSRKDCNNATWGTIEAFLAWCKQKWTAEEGINDAEKAFVGLIWMIEAFITGRKLIHSLRKHLDNNVSSVHESLRIKIAAAAAQAEENPLMGVNASLLSAKQPAMPLSPESIAAANSTNSTPATRGGGTPNIINGNARQPSTQPALRPTRHDSGNSPVPFALLPTHLQNSTLPIPPEIMEAMATCSESVDPKMVQDLKDVAGGYVASAYCMSASQSTLNLPVLCRLYPSTFARMMFSSLLPTEEHEPDIEDEEGELFWPGQLVNGQGLGWVCLMGKAMIKEFGKAYGYTGLDGVISKPKSDTEPGRGPPLPSAQGHSLPPRPQGGQGQGLDSSHMQSNGLSSSLQR